jgi:hypothetical protein
MKFNSPLDFLKKLAIFKDENFYYYLIMFIFVIVVGLFTIVSQIYYVYIHGFNYTRCNFMNNNDKSKCVTKSDMRNFLYNKLIS